MSGSVSIFKKQYDIDKRIAESAKIREKHPNKIPVIVSKYKKCNNLEEIKNKKFLVPQDLTIAQFSYVIKKRINITSEQAIYLYIKNAIPNSTTTMANIYSEFQDEDGFLYITYAGENAFGSN